jgi:asparagine synthase (glutamine-hydrolysing)
MCGITGFLSSTMPAHAEAIGARMAEAIQYRGPDDQGVWLDRDAGVLLAHRRLAIVDLSAAGHQPMTSPSGRFTMVFNGEVYNHLTLRKELDAHPQSPGTWRGHSDTETLLAAMDAWGIDATLQRAVGMFAMAIWDRQCARLFLVRDRFGEKPLYYGWVGQGAEQTFVFGSDLHALRSHPAGPSSLNREALGLYMRFLCVPAPWSIFQGIYKLEPGCELQVQPGASAPAQPPRAGDAGAGWAVRRWWSLDNLVAAGSRAPYASDEEAIQALDDALSEAVRLQSNADVPLGAFLSGGVDSSLIVALMCKHATQPVRTFTIGFDDFGVDETPHAAAVARHLGTVHTAHVYSAQDVLDAIPRMASVYSEPFADASQVPTLMVCQSARAHVTVALSGDAGDELFGGYNRYFWGPRFWNRLAWMPPAVRHGLGGMLQGIPASGWDAAAAPLMSTLRRRVWAGAGAAGVGDKLHRLGHRLQTVHHEDDLYLSLISEWQSPQDVVRGDIGRAAAHRPADLLGALPTEGLDASPLSMLYRDTMGYLPDDILCKVDRAAMAVSLETRAPLLDHRVAEVAWRMPAHMKLRAGHGKWALKQVLDRYVPRALIERPKSGFGVPIGQWLRGPLRPWAEDLLCAANLHRSGVLEPAPIQARWQTHLSGRHDHTGSLWAVLMFQSWLQREGL